MERINEYTGIVFCDDFADAGAIGSTWHGTDRNIYVLGTREDPREVLFACPCGNQGDHVTACGPVSIPVALQHDAGKAWGIQFHDDGTLTLHPSILTKKRANEEHIHIFLRNNKVVWC